MENDKAPVSSQDQLFQNALKVMPGGVSRNTVFRNPRPDYAGSGQGCYVTDLDGNTRIDLANNMASLIHGHAHPEVVRAVVGQVQKGTAFTMATRPELDLASLLCDRVPWFEQIRFMNSGTEAVMAAIKAARAATGKPAVAKAEGTYHGTYDFAEVSQSPQPDNWGPAEQPASVAVARGTPRTVLDDVIVFPFNDVEKTLACLNRHASRISCILIDPVPQRAGLIRASEEFIAALRHWANEHQTILVFDEVISFRMSLRGAADWYDDKPDLTTLGKIIGGGFPVGALAGRRDLMSLMDPSSEPLPFPWSGTFSANPVTMAAGLATMRLFDEVAIEKINRTGHQLRKRIESLIHDLGVTGSVTGEGSLFRIHPKPETPHDYRSAWQNPAEQSRTRALVSELYNHGFMTFRTGTGALSTAFGEAESEQFLDALKLTLPRTYA